ncbi:MAG: hypothetical protein OEW63_03570 [Gammaproteobacteria bacterium]|nr:hypothetical protein [Gammaproteobacteria bacterium]
MSTQNIVIVRIYLSEGRDNYQRVVNWLHEVITEVLKEIQTTVKADHIVSWSAQSGI